MHTNNTYQKTTKSKPLKSLYKPFSEQAKGKVWVRENKRSESRFNVS